MTDADAPPGAEASRGGDTPGATGPADGTPSHGGGRVRRLVAAVDRPVAGVLAAAFVVSRVGAYLLGVRFDPSMLPLALQHLDLRALEDHLLQSLWYQHDQPPAFNLLIGLVLKFSPLSPELTFHLLWLALGVALVVIVHALLRGLGVGRWVAVVATVVITASPTVLLYENWFAYEYPLTVGLTALGLAALRWVRHGSLWALAALVLLAGGASLTRSLLHPVWFVAVVALALLARRPARAERWAGAAIVAVPTLLIAVLLVKNVVLFSSPSFSTWFGWNFQRVSIDELPPDVKQQLIDDGTLTRMANIPVFLPLENYAGEVPPCTPAHPDVPVLADPTKPTTLDEEGKARENFNAECYLPILRQAQSNALAAAKARPKDTVRAVVGSLQIWSESSSQYAFVYDNRQHINTIDQWYRQLVLLDVPYDPPVKTNAGWWIPLGTPGGRWRFSITIIVGTLVTVGFGLRGVWRVLRRRTSVNATDAALAVIGTTVGFVTVVGNVFEIGENNRFRFMVEPLTLVVLTWAAVQAVRWWRTRRTSTP